MDDKINVTFPQSRPVLVVLWQTTGRAINQYKHDCCRGNQLQQVAGIWFVYSCQEPIDIRLCRIFYCRFIIYTIYCLICLFGDVRNATSPENHLKRRIWIIQANLRWFVSNETIKSASLLNRLQSFLLDLLKSVWNGSRNCLFFPVVIYPSEIDSRMRHLFGWDVFCQ